MFNRIWNEARNTEHPLETYRRINGLTQAQLNRADRRVRPAPGDLGLQQPRQLHAVHPEPSTARAFINAYNGGTGRRRQPGGRALRDPEAMAPSDYGYNKIRLVPSTDGALIRLHLKGHANSAAPAPAGRTASSR